ISAADADPMRPDQDLVGPEGARWLLDLLDPDVLRGVVADRPHISSLRRLRLAIGAGRKVVLDASAALLLGSRVRDLDQLECYPVGVREIGPAPPRQHALFDRVGRTEEVDALRAQLLVPRLDVVDEEADVVGPERV